jgi:putative sterol carrier protein
VAPIAATRLTEDVLPPDLFEKLKPEFVAPIVLYLCSEGCEENGGVFNAGLGYFNRTAVVSGPGITIGDGKTIPTVEEIHRHWEAINSLERAKEFTNVTAALGDMLMASPPPGEETQAGAGLSVQGIFEKMPQAFQTDKASGVNVIFQYRISGPKGGDWHTTIKECVCQVAQGLCDSPTTTIKMMDDDFLALMEGKLKAMQAFTTGKLKIEGDIMKSQLIEKLFKF